MVPFTIRADSGSLPGEEGSIVNSHLVFYARAIVSLGFSCALVLALVPAAVKGANISAERFARNAIQGVIKSAGKAGVATICSIALPKALCDIVSSSIP